MGVYRRKAQYHETDQMGIIHHSNYVKWMEEARIDFMKELGFGYGEVEKRGIVSPVAGVSVSYKKPVLFDDDNPNDLLLLFLGSNQILLIVC